MKLLIGVGFLTLLGIGASDLRGEDLRERRPRRPLPPQEETARARPLGDAYLKDRINELERRMSELERDVRSLENDNRDLKQRIEDIRRHHI